MIVAKTQTIEREKQLLEQWFETVQFDEESEGIPPLEAENDDEGRFLTLANEEIRNLPGDLSSVDTDLLMAELRKRDPDNPF